MCITCSRVSVKSLGDKQRCRDKVPVHVFLANELLNWIFLPCLEIIQFKFGIACIWELFHVPMFQFGKFFEASCLWEKLNLVSATFQLIIALEDVLPWEDFHRRRPIWGILESGVWDCLGSVLHGRFVILIREFLLLNHEVGRKLCNKCGV